MVTAGVALAVAACGSSDSNDAGGNAKGSSGNSEAEGLLDPVFNGKNILQANNANWTQLDDPALNEQIAKAAALPIGSERNKAWGQVDRMATALAPGIPFIWDKIPTVESPNVRGVINQYSTSWDLGFTSLK